MLVDQIADGRCEVENQYKTRWPMKVTCWHKALEEVFELKQTSEWRGLGKLQAQGVQLTQAYQFF